MVTVQGVVRYVKVEGETVTYRKLTVECFLFEKPKAEFDCSHACVVGGLELLLLFGMFCELLFSL